MNATPAGSKNARIRECPRARKMHKQPIGCWGTKVCLKRLSIRPRHNQLNMDSGRRDASYSCPPTKSGQLSMDPISMRAVAPESSMDPTSVQIERLSVQKTCPWTISSAFFAEIPSMDPISMHAIVQGPRISAKGPMIRADIGSMDGSDSHPVNKPHLLIARQTWPMPDRQIFSWAPATNLVCPSRQTSSNPIWNKPTSAGKQEGRSGERPFKSC